MSVSQIRLYNIFVIFERRELSPSTALAIHHYCHLILYFFFQTLNGIQIAQNVKDTTIQVFFFFDKLDGTM